MQSILLEQSLFIFDTLILYTNLVLELWFLKPKTMHV